METKSNHHKTTTTAKGKHMYTRKIHNHATGITRARGIALKPQETLQTLIADELDTFPDAWGDIRTTIRDDRHAVITFRDGQYLATRTAPDMDITIHITLSPAA